jgi:branched-chain amino acid transport system substrate-binding protein
MQINRRTLLASALTAAAAGARAQGSNVANNVIRIGVLNDRSGPNSSLSGVGSETAARMACEKFGYKVRGMTVEIVVADHQNKPDIGVAIARKWYDNDGVDVIVDISNSAVSLAVNGLVKERPKLVLHNSAAVDLTGKACASRAVQWQYSSWAASSNCVTKEMIAGGLDSFFILAVDYALGVSIADPFSAAINRMGGKIVGHVKHPLGTSDFSSYLLQAQASGAKAIMLANGGADTINAIKQAREFGLTPKVLLLAAALTKDGIQAVGLETLQGLQMASWYHPYRDDAAIAWLKAFMARNNGHVPSEPQAATYSSVNHYLKAIDAIGSKDADAVIAQLKKMTINDEFASNGHLRDDGIMSHDMYLCRLKAPSESKGEGDYINVMRVLSGEEANVPLAQSGCPLVKV